MGGDLNISIASERSRSKSRREIKEEEDKFEKFLKVQDEFIKNQQQKLVSFQKY